MAASMDRDPLSQRLPNGAPDFGKPPSTLVKFTKGCVFESLVGLLRSRSWAKCSAGLRNAAGC